MFETVKNRRTIRKYQQKDIAPDLLNDLLETSFRASTMGGMQLYSVIVTRDAEMKEKLSAETGIPYYDDHSRLSGRYSGPGGPLASRSCRASGSLP